MKTVIVSWTTEDQVMPAGTAPAHHFRVGLGASPDQEFDVSLAVREHTFTNVSAGVMAGFVVVCAEDGTELAPPITFSVEVPADVVVPIPVSASGAVQ